MRCPLNPTLVMSWHLCATAKTACERGPVIDVSIVMPCLNERRTLGHCIAVARDALEVLKERHALVGEIVIADNGSTDGSQEFAVELGGRVVDVARRGYGAAVCGGFEA